VAPGTDPSFQNISASDGKYSNINREFMEKKWFFNHFIEEKFDVDIEFVWNNEKYLAKLKEGMETPVFYSYSLLEAQKFTFAPKRISAEKTILFKKIINRLKYIYQIVNSKKLKN
jgi:hypothetical protein